jgi:DNA-binding transcriptional ArsR family regulator
MSDQLSQIFSALADPTRRAMLARLAEGEANVSALAEPFLGNMSLPAVTKHLKVLERAGLITKVKNAQWRSCQMNGKPLREATDWIETYHNMWSASFAQLDQYLKDVAKRKPKGKRK